MLISVWIKYIVPSCTPFCRLGPCHLLRPASWGCSFWPEIPLWCAECSGPLNLATIGEVTPSRPLQKVDPNSLLLLRTMLQRPFEDSTTAIVLIWQPASKSCVAVLSFFQNGRQKVFVCNFMGYFCRGSQRSKAVLTMWSPGKGYPDKSCLKAVLNSDLKLSWGYVLTQGSKGMAY